MPRKIQGYDELIELLGEVASRAAALQRDAIAASKSVQSVARLREQGADPLLVSRLRETMADKLANLAFRLWIMEKFNPALYGLTKLSLKVRVDLRGIARRAKKNERRNWEDSPVPLGEDFADVCKLRRPR
jgi:hypothetical protein